MEADIKGPDYRVQRYIKENNPEHPGIPKGPWVTT